MIFSIFCGGGKGFPVQMLWQSPESAIGHRLCLFGISCQGCILMKSHQAGWIFECSQYRMVAITMQTLRWMQAFSPSDTHIYCDLKVGI